MRRLSIVIAATVAATAALIGAVPASASGLSPCGRRVINDWYDNGKIDHVYAISCYRDALDNLPPDVEAYANARDVITAAMRLQNAANNRATANPGNTDTSTTGSGGTDTTPPVVTTETGPDPVDTKPMDTTSTETDQTTTEAAPTPTPNPPEPPVNAAFNAVGPKDASSVPVPLIVLGVLGLLLLAAGAAGVVARKLQERRTPATPGGSPPVDTPPAA